MNSQDEARLKSVPIRSGHFSAIVALVDDGRRLKQCLHSLRWVPQIFVVSRDNHAEAKAIVANSGGRWLVSEKEARLSLWEQGLFESKTEWVILVGSNEIITGRLRSSIVETIKTRPTEAISFPFPRTTVYLSKQLKYPLESQDPSALLFINEPGINFKSIPRGSGKFVGDLVHYGAETLTEAWMASVARASDDAEVMASASPPATVSQLARKSATALVKTMCNALWTQKAFKEGFEGIVWTLTELNRVLLCHLRYYEKYVRGGELLRRNLSRINKVLIIKLREVGDNVLLTPLLSNLKKSLPRVSISVLTYHYSKAVFENNPAIDKIFGLSKNPSSAEKKELIQNLNREFFDLGVNLHAGKLSSTILKDLNMEHKLNHNYIGKSRNYTILIPASDRYRSSIERDLDFLRVLGIAPEENTRPEIYLKSEEIDWARKEIELMNFDVKKKLIIVHPTSAVEIREWGMERFGQLIRLLNENTDAQVLVICSPAEYPRVQPLYQYSPRLQVSHRANLRQMMALIREADLLIDNDSSPSHVAAAFGIPTIVLSSQNIREIFRPYDDKNDRHYVFYKDVDCRECGKDQCDDRICLDFRPEEVFEKCVEMLKD